MNHPKIIRSAQTMEQSSKKVADGIIHSAMMTSFQRDAMDGIIKSAIPEKVAAPVKQIHKSKPSKTPQAMGFVHYPGSKYA